MPTESEYQAAKRHQSDNPDLYRAAEPTDEVLANVRLISEYEADQQLKLEQSGEPQ